MEISYYNDLPRFLEAISDNHIIQDSCLHGNANLNTILTWGNGMYRIWGSGAARIFNYHRGRIHDFGACSVQQLLLGYDEELEARVEEVFGNSDDDGYDDNQDDAQQQQQRNDDDGFMADDEVERVYSDDAVSYNDGSNPCLRNPHYYQYLVTSVYSHNQHHHWDYIVLNDNTRSPARAQTREATIQVLEDTYVPWFLETGATPIFLCTYAYWSQYRDMTGLESVPIFTSLTVAGYNAYVNAIADLLPDSQRPRIAPVAMVFLMVWEENYNLWQRLFHVDEVHCGPLGTYLQALVIHHTIFGRLPHPEADMSELWLRTRRFQPIEHHRDPFPTHEEAQYLHQIVARVCVYGQIPRSFIHYTNEEAVYYVPQDDLYRIDDLF